MGWSTSGYSYTQDQIGSTAYNAGCGSGYFWIHTGSPHMFIKGYINDGGAYSFTFYKPNSSHFGYYLKIYACGKLIFDLTASDLNYKTCSQTVSGTFSEAEYNANRTLHADCQANEGCVSSLSMDGVVYYIAPSNLSLSCTGRTTRSLTFKASWKAGNKGSTNTITIGSTRKTVTNGGTVTFTGLNPNTSYTAVLHVNDGTDYTKQCAASTLSAVSNAKIYAVASGTTIRVTPSWATNSSTGCKAYITCNGTTLTQTTSGSSVRFVGLYNGTSYTISMYVEDNELNKSTASNVSIETYEVSFGQKDSSTKAIQFTEYISAGEDTSKQLVYKISGGNASNSNTNYNGKVIESNLDHNTTYTITGWIRGAINEYGYLDTVKTITIKTKELSVINTSYIQHQKYIESIWQSKVNGENCDIDNLIGDYFNFKLSNCKNVGYKHNDDTINNFTYATPSNNGSVSGDYTLDKRLVSSDLDYWAWYNIICAITDGHNIVSSILDINTLFPYSLIYVNGEYKKVMPYVYTDGKWINSPAYIHDSTWKESGTDT